MIAPAHITHHHFLWYWNWVYFAGMLPGGVVLYMRSLYQASHRFPEQRHFWACFWTATMSMFGWYITVPLNMLLNRGDKNGYMFFPLTKEWRLLAYKSKYPSLGRDLTLETWNE